MDRRTLLKALGAVGVASLLGQLPGALAAPNARVARIARPPAFWRDKVTPAAFAVLFQEATERPHSSPLDREKRAGTFVCAACHLPLFHSRDKYDSGTGWPSFTRASEGHTGRRVDRRLVLPRIEYHCARCGGHQGHVFDDGPAPRGERWCNNGVALRFVVRGERLPPLRG